MNIDDFHRKCEGTTLEANIYKTVRGLLSDYNNQVEIRKEFPKQSIERCNTGYAVDVMLEMALLLQAVLNLILCSLIAYSEGTLAFLTEIKVNVVPVPPKESGLLCVHFNSLMNLLRANLIALKYGPSASELIDHYILRVYKR